MLSKTLHLFCGLLLLSVMACNTTPAEETTEMNNEGATAQTVAEETAAESMDDYSDGLQIGETAPDFNLKNIDGEMYSLGTIKDANGNDPKGYIVTFTCNTCPFAVKYEDRIIELHNDLAPQGYPVVAIMPNDPVVQPGDSFEAMQQRAEDKGFPFLYLMDEGQEIYPQYGAGRTPEIYLLDSDRILRYHGAIDDNVDDPDAVTINYVKNAVEAIEDGRTPEPAEVKAIGCTIKVKK